MVSYIERNGKYVFCKEGVYFAATLEQVKELYEACQLILSDQNAAVSVRTCKHL